MFVPVRVRQIRVKVPADEVLHTSGDLDDGHHEALQGGGIVWRKISA